MNIVRLVLEISRPIRSVDTLFLMKRIAGVKGVKSIIVKFNKISSEVQTLTLILEGENIDYNVIAKTLEEMNIVITDVIEIHALTT